MLDWIYPRINWIEELSSPKMQNKMMQEIQPGCYYEICHSLNLLQFANK